MARNKQITESKANAPFYLISANDRMERASKQSVPNMLFSECIYEKDLTVLFAPAGVGKTVLAMHIADSISQGKSIEGFKNEAPAQPVVYFDLELSDVQFQGRYAKKIVGFDNKKKFIDNNKWSKNLGIALFDLYDTPKGVDEVDFLMEGIIEMANKAKSKIIFIDNISWLASQGMEKSKDASVLMKKLTNLKRDNGFTLIVLAHTPKRLKWQPIELMDLAGSALIGNFIDACFTINYSTFEGDKNSRYIKQLKCRFSEMIFHSESVKTVKLARVKENFTGIEVCVPDELDNYNSERNHLSKVDNPATVIVTPEVSDNNKKKTVEVLQENPDASSRDIAKLVGVSHTTVQKYTNELFNNNGQ